MEGCSSVQFSFSVVSDSLRPHEPQHARPRGSSSFSGVLGKKEGILSAGHSPPRGGLESLPTTSALLQLPPDHIAKDSSMGWQMYLMKKHMEAWSTSSVSRPTHNLQKTENKE